MDPLIDYRFGFLDLLMDGLFLFYRPTQFFGGSLALPFTASLPVLIFLRYHMHLPLKSRYIPQT